RSALQAQNSPPPNLTPLSHPGRFLWKHENWPSTAQVGLSTLAMLLLMLPLVEGPERGWAGWPIAMLAASPVAFVGFYLHQRWKSRHGLSPLLETDLFGDRAFNIGALLILFFWGSTTPFSFSYVLLMQTGYGHSPLATAGSLAILGGAFGIVSPIAGRLT